MFDGGYAAVISEVGCRFTLDNLFAHQDLLFASVVSSLERLGGVGDEDDEPVGVLRHLCLCG